VLAKCEALPTQRLYRPENATVAPLELSLYWCYFKQPDALFPVHIWIRCLARERALQFRGRRAAEAVGKPCRAHLFAVRIER
jgi:hypothetical protein